MKRGKRYLTFIIFLAIILVFSFGKLSKREDNEKRIISPTTSTTVAYAATANDIQSEMNKLMSEIEREMRNNPDVAIQGHPGKFIKDSESYQKIVHLGLKAVKPMYDMLYESRDAGLYEYILAMAIQDITGEEFVYNTDYGWKNSLEFRMAYEEKVNNTKFNVERIMADENMNDDEKVKNLEEQGVFGVSSLIKEYNDKNSKVPKSVIEKAISKIKSRYSGYAVTGSRTATDRVNEEKEIFDSLVELNGKAYK